MLILYAIVIGLWIVYPWAISYLFPDLGERGQFGDMFGAINALFAGFAFAGIILAIILQKNELSLQREELKLQRTELAQTREEIKGQKEQLKAQDNTLKKQNFENSFFQLLRFHVDIVDSLKTSGAYREIAGRGCFAQFNSDLTRLHEDAEPGSDINEIWRLFAHSNDQRVDHYFRHLYNTVKFVDQYAFLQHFEEKRQYTNLIRGQLSTFEPPLLFYKCLSEKGDKFKCLVERYSLLEGMDIKVLLDSGHKSKYAAIAYGTTIG